jgi:ankyrin repeat protein
METKNNNVVNLKRLKQLIDEIETNYKWHNNFNLSREFQTTVNKIENINETDAKENTILHYACKKQCPSIIKVLLEKMTLLEKNSDFNIKNIDGKTPLHYACKYGSKTAETDTILELLIGAGADINAQTNDNRTPLHYAIERKNTNIIKILIEHNASKNLANTKGKTPLDYARNKDINL